MYYSLIGLLALLILVISNHDVILHRVDDSWCAFAWLLFFVPAILGRAAAKNLFISRLEGFSLRSG